MINVQYWLPFGFSFLSAHYYAALVFIGALALHLVLKLPIVAKTFAREGAFRPLGEGIERMRAADPEVDTLASPAPAAPTISRRGMLGAVGLGSLGLVVMTARRQPARRRSARSPCSPRAGRPAARPARTTSSSTRPPSSPGSRRR